MYEQDDIKAIWITGPFRDECAVTMNDGWTYYSSFKD